MKVELHDSRLMHSCWMKNLGKKIGRTPTCPKIPKNDAINNINLITMRQNVVFHFAKKICRKALLNPFLFFWVQKWWSLASGGADINRWVEYLIGNLLLLHGQVADTFMGIGIGKGRACDRVKERVLKLSRLSRSSHMYSQTLSVSRIWVCTWKLAFRQEDCQCTWDISDISGMHVELK